MIFKETELKGVYIIEPEQLRDDRGFFARTYCQREFEKNGLNPRFVQANMSFNRLKGTLRGMHYQRSPYEEAKLVRCTKGSIYDVVIDLRENSRTFRKWIGVELSDSNYRMLYVPENFAHGFITLEDNVEVAYQVSQFYSPGSEDGIRYDDPAINIEWPVEVRVISEKDRSWPYLS